MHRSQIDLIDLSTGREIASAPQHNVLLTSAGTGWKGIKVELQHFGDFEIQPHLIKEHRLIINLGKPVGFEWLKGGEWKRKTYPYGSFALQTDGDFNAPRWRGSFQFLSFALDPSFMDQLVERDFSGKKIVFTEQRGVADPAILHFGNLFRGELQAGAYAGKVYGETLTLAFSLYLLSRYATDQLKIDPPKGKLSARQLGTVLDYTQAHLARDLSLESIAEQANLSPFHFSRLFKQTTGHSLHQFIVHLKIERAKQLIAKRGLSLTEVAHLTGFYDQSHFIHTFKRTVGMNPKDFARTA